LVRYYAGWILRYPAPFEAVLGTKEALLSILLTLGALQRASLVGAIYAEALDHGVRGHEFAAGGDGEKRWRKDMVTLQP
jgi:hypothetical protein